MRLVKEVVVVQRILSTQLPAHVGATVRLAGWVHRRRLLKSVAFLIVRDAAGLAQVIDDVERQLKRDLGDDPAVWRAKGFGEYPDGPRLTHNHVLRLPELAIAAINCARRLEAGLPHLHAQRPAPETVVRLRWPSDANA